MKYAILDSIGVIRRVSDGQPLQAPEDGSVVEISDAQAAAIAAERADGKIPRMLDGIVMIYSLVPDEIEPAQLREWLIRNAKLVAVNTALDAIADEGQKAIMKSWFEFAVKIRRDNPKVAAIAQALTMSNEEVDTAFREAADY